MGLYASWHDPNGSISVIGVIAKRILCAGADQAWTIGARLIVHHTQGRSPRRLQGARCEGVA